MPKTPKSQIFCCLAVGLCFLTWAVIDFLGGYNGCPFTIGLFTISVIPFLLAGILTLIVIISGLRSIFLKRQAILSGVLIVVTIGFWFSPRLYSQKPYLLGFKYRVLEITSPQELREIAAKARELRTEQSFYLPGPGKWFLWDPNTDGPLWEKMPKYKILDELNSSVLISVLNDDSVELEWGGELVGHWGIEIGKHSMQIEHELIPSKQRIYERIFIEHDIAVCMFD